MDWKIILQNVGVLLGLLYLWLEYRADIRLWIVGLIMPVVHGALYYKAGLYADSSMQLYYVLAGLYGWIVWHNARRKALRPGPGGAKTGTTATEYSAPASAREPEKPQAPDRKSAQEPTSAPAIGHTPLRLVPALVGVYAAAHIVLYLLLKHFTNSTVPFWDAMTTAASIVAMWMLSRKYVEQWLVWLVVDVLTVGLYLYKDIPRTAGLYALYSVLAVAGYLRWRKQAVTRVTQ